MDIIITKLKKKFLKSHLDEFINILLDEPNEYWRAKHFLKDLPNKFEISCVALHNRKVIGYIISSQKNDCAHIHKFMVEKSYRNQKIGQQLQECFENNAKFIGINTIELCVFHSNKKALKFYQNLHFLCIKNRIDTVTQDELIIMRKEL